MGRKQLQGVSLVENWTSLGGALEGALRFLGLPSVTAWVMGVSGLAFRLALVTSDEGVAAPGAETAFDPARLERLLANLGRRATILVAHPDGTGYAKRREEAIKRVRKSIDRGVPAIAFDLHLPKFGLITGYDDATMSWSVRTVLSGQFGERLALARWPVPEQGGPVLVVLLDGRGKVDPRRAIAEALNFAVAYAERGEPGDPSGAIHGLAAYERWIAPFQDAAPLSPRGNAALVQQLQAARRDAATFLRGDAARALPAAVHLFMRAASAYEAEVMALSRMATMFPFPNGGDPASPASRVVALGALRAALDEEQEAIAALREGLGRV